MNLESDDVLKLVVLAVAFGTVGFFVRLIWRETRRQKRLERHQCEECGYELRGSVGRCPECGLAFDRTQAVEANEVDRLLLRHLPDVTITPREPDENEPLSIVYHTPREYWRAEAVAAQLNARGVWASVECRDIYIPGPDQCSTQEVIAVLVPSTDAERAENIVALFRKPGPAVLSTDGHWTGSSPSENSRTPAPRRSRGSIPQPPNAGATENPGRSGERPGS